MKHLFQSLQWMIFKRLYFPLVDEEGQALVEYTLILALVSIVAIGVLTILGTDIVTKLKTVANAIIPNSAP